jgi:hypothetical protein
MEVDDAATTAGGDAESVWDDDVGEADNLTCRRCYRMLHKASQLLLEHTESWCGGLHGVCFRCSEHNPKEKPERLGEEPPAPDNEGDDDAEDAECRRKFKREANRRWAKRSQELKEKSRRVRSVTFATLVAEVAKIFPDASKLQLRSLSIARIRASVTAFVASVAKNPFMQAAAKFCTNEYFKAVDSEAARPTSVPEHKARTLSSSEAQFLDRLTDSFAVLFCCRNKDCMMASRSTDWLRSTVRHQFACPACHQKYRPWVQSEGRSEAQRAILIRDPITTAWSVFPASWPSTAEDNWLMSMAEAYARDVQCPESLSQFVAGQAVRLSDLLARIGTAAPEGLQFVPLDRRACLRGSRVVVVQFGDG